MKCTPVKYEMLNWYVNPWRCSVQCDFCIDRVIELSVIDLQVTRGGKGPATAFCAILLPLTVKQFIYYSFKLNAFYKKLQKNCKNYVTGVI